MIKIVKWLILTFIIIAPYSVGAQSPTINAASCKASDVQTALNSVSADCTTVKIPSGNCGWSTTVTYSRPYTVIIAGAGNEGAIGGGDATVITDNMSGSHPVQPYGLP